MKKILMIVLTLSLTGCYAERTGEDRERAVAYCKSHGNMEVVGLESAAAPMGRIVNFGCRAEGDTWGYTMVPDSIYRKDQ